jgi:hypothetical protein
MKLMKLSINTNIDNAISIATLYNPTPRNRSPERTQAGGDAVSQGNRSSATNRIMSRDFAKLAPLPGRH